MICFSKAIFIFKVMYSKFFYMFVFTKFLKEVTFLLQNTYSKLHVYCRIRNILTKLAE